MPPWPVCLETKRPPVSAATTGRSPESTRATGVALVANDMHLAIGVPNIWYRASIKIAGAAGSMREAQTITGVTLARRSQHHRRQQRPRGVGIHQHRRRLERSRHDRTRPARSPDHYLTPSGPRAVDVFDEQIATSEGSRSNPSAFAGRSGGPSFGATIEGASLRSDGWPTMPRFWPGDVTAPERARNVDEVLAAAAGLGIPAQNFVAGDSTGRIGWTIAGPIPHRVGFDGSRPVSWADGSRRWDGYLATRIRPDDRRSCVGAASGLRTRRSSTAPMLADHRRRRVCRRDSRAHDSRSADGDRPGDAGRHARRSVGRLRALFHERWRTVVLEVLSPAAIAGHDQRGEFRRLVESTWTGRADPASVAYRLVRTFRAHVSRIVFAALTAPAKAAEPDFDFSRALRSEGPLWQLIVGSAAASARSRIRVWDALLVAAVDRAIGELTVDGGRLSDRTWGDFNRASVTHPLGNAVPLVGQWLNMPADPLPGDIYTPRAHSPRAGPSERMVVSPGREDEGILHMPTGQSGHPLVAALWRSASRVVDGRTASVSAGAGGGHAHADTGRTIDHVTVIAGPRTWQNTRPCL